MRSALLFLTAMACGLSPPPDPADYDDSCVVAEDCVAVQDNLLDCSCGCPSLAALSHDGADAFLADQDAYRPPNCRDTCLLGCAPLDPDAALLECVDARCEIVGNAPDSATY